MHNGNGARLDNERARGRPHAVSHWRRHLDVRHDTRVAPCIGLMHHCPPSRTCAGLHTHSRYPPILSPPLAAPAPPARRLRNTRSRVSPRRAAVAAVRLTYVIAHVACACARVCVVCCYYMYRGRWRSRLPAPESGASRRGASTGCVRVAGSGR
jgi:hypothetical protein